MKPIIMDLKDMTYSREFMESRPNPIIPIFIYVLISILVIALLWSCFGEIDIYVKSTGVVRPNDKVSSIRNFVTGKVESVFYEEGKEVKKGDILFTLESKNLELERDNLSKQLKKAKVERSNLEKFKQSILDNTNYFDETSEAEKEYYYKYLKFTTDQEITRKQTANTSLDMQQLTSSEKYTQEVLRTQIDNTEDKLKNLELLKQSIEANKSKFASNTGEYYSRFLEYTLSKQTYSMELEQKKEAYDSAIALYDIGAISKVELDHARNSYENADITSKSYSNKVISQLKTELKQSKDQLKELTLSLEKSNMNSTVYQGKQQYNASSVEKLRLDTLVQIDEQLDAVENSVETLEKNLNSTMINIQNSTISAPIDGTVNVINEVNMGDFIQAGMEIATIIPDNNSEYRVQLYVSNKDIANLKEGQAINYHFYALPYREYGAVEGKIVKIGTDAKVDQGTGMSYYPVEATVQNKPLYSYKGVKAEIKVGMTCDAQVITGSKKIMFWALEKMNLRD